MTVPRYFIDFLNAEIGLDVDSTGLMHVERAIDERLRATRLPNTTAYQTRLQADSAERQALIEAVVVGETWFFRDREAFHTAARLARQQFAGTPLRLLSLPCSTGEEPYSLAMALLDAGMPPDSFHIDAIDISAEAIAAAGRGIYGNNAFRGRQLDFRARHFTAVPGGQRLNDPVRARVRFRQGNLFDPALLAGEAPYDLVFCRNVLIYFDRDAQQRAISTLCARLAPQGLLFVGPAESGLLVRAQLRPAGIPLAFAFHPPTADEPAPRRMPRPAPLRSLRPLPVSPVTPVAPPHIAFASPPAAPPPTVPDSLTRARQLADSGQFDQATAICERLIEREGPSADLLFLLALIADASGRPDEAHACYRKTLYLDPAHEQALLHLASLLDSRGDATGARRLAERAHRARGTHDV